MPHSTATSRPGPRGSGGAAALLLLCLPPAAHAQAPLPGEKVVLSVKVESPDPARSLGAVVGILWAEGLLPTERVTVPPGGAVSEIIKDRFQLPGVGEPLAQAVAKLNPGIPDLDRVKAGETLVLPQAPSPYESYQVFWKGDPRAEKRHEQRTRSWGSVRLEPPSPESGGDAFLRETYRGYEYRLVTGDVEAARQAADALWGVGGELGLRVALTPDNQAAVVPRYSSRAAPEQYWRSCTLGSGVEADAEASYAALLPHLLEWDVGDKPEGCRGTAAAPRPTVILIDRPVYPHTELGGVRRERRDGVEVDVAGGVRHEGFNGAELNVEGVLRALASEQGRLAASALTPVDGGGGAVRCATDEFTEERDHGTHLAGIIASLADSRGFSGLASGVDLRSIDDGYNLEQLNELLRREAAASVMAPLPRVFVFAKPFPHMGLEDVETRNYAARLLDPVGQLPTPETRRKHESAAIVGEQSGDVWVVAAGQDEATPEGQPPRPVTLTAQTPLAPQNLGDLPNVIVATTCAACGGDASLWPRANRAGGAGMVAVAAPGLDIPGAIAGNAYARPRGGTSESAAFVGGVVAAMLSCGYDRYARFPGQIKRRLRLTGRPDLRREGTDELSDVVVVDPRAALLDPARDWLLRPDSVEPGIHKPVEVEGWCDELLRGRQNNVAVNLETRAIRRLVRLRPGEDAWAVLHVADAGSPEQGDIKVAGPLKLPGGDDRDLLRVRGAGGAMAGLPRSQIDDLILSGGRGERSCQAAVAAGSG